MSVLRFVSIAALLAALPLAPATLAAQDNTEEEKEESLLTKLGSIFTIYGFVQLDAAWSDSRFGLDAQLAGFVRSEDPDAPRPGTGAPKDESEFTMYTRLARLGVDLHFGKVDLLEAEVGGKIELDFYAIPASNSRNMLRMRHAYLTLGWGEIEVLAGQTSDLIAPLFPAINYDLVMWGAGNLGDRRPQARVTGRLKFGDAGLTLAAMAGLTGAVDNQDLDNNGVLDGVQAALPTLQARAAFSYRYFAEGKPAELGLWAHWAREEIDDFGIGGRDQNHFNSWAVGFDLYIPLWQDRVWIQAEGWVGENLDDVRGGIFQGVTADGREIHAKGGWIEIGAKLTGWMNAHIGVATDDPEARHLPGTGRVRNEIAYMKLDWRFGPVYFAIEYSYWETEYKAFGAGRANRVKGYAGYSF